MSELPEHIDGNDISGTPSEHPGGGEEVERSVSRPAGSTQPARGAQVQ